MGFVEIRFRAQENPFPLDQLVEKLLQSCSGAEVTCDDWYADKRRKTLRIIADCTGAGEPILHPEMLLDGLDRAAKEAGPRKEITIPLREGGHLKGDVSRDRLVLAAGFPLKDNETVMSIVDLLYSLKLVANVEVG